MMTLKTFVLLTALAVMSLTPAIARDTVIGLSTQQSPKALQAQIERVIGHLTETLAPGETAIFFDATGVRQVATFAAPNSGGPVNPRALLQANRTALGALKHFIDTAEAIPGRAGQIDLPGLLRSLRQNYPVGEDGADLIVLGAPITDDPTAPSVSMRGGRVPNDGHIASIAGTSLYGTAGLPGTLAGYDVYFGLTGAPWKISEAHGYHMERLWALSVESHGGALAYFGDDLNTLFGLAGEDAPARTHAAPLVPTDKLEMLVFAPDTGAVADIYTQPLQPAPAPEPVWAAAQNVRIGITWDVAAADVDLYVRPNPAAEVVYYANANTAEGRLFKDLRHSPVNGFETVALTTGAVDLSQVKLALNFYSGGAPATGVTGEIRIAIDERVWAAPFTIPARAGNKGLGAETALVAGTVPNDAWVLIDPLAVLTGD